MNASFVRYTCNIFSAIQDGIVWFEDRNKRVAFTVSALTVVCLLHGLA